MKNVQIRDGADNATFSIFRATEEEFSYLFPGPGQDIEIMDDFMARLHESHANEILSNLWHRPIHKSKVIGIHGTLFFNYSDKRQLLPASKREIDRDSSQINRCEQELYARMHAEEESDPDTPTPPTSAELLCEIPGGPQLLDWFGGRVPSFHDAEVLKLVLDRQGARCSIEIHTFQMTPEVDAKGFFVLDKHVVVSFLLEGLTSVELNDFNEQNAIYGLSLSHTADQGFRLELDPCWGLFGFVEARDLTIELTPGKPSDGVHQRPG